MSRKALFALPVALSLGGMAGADSWRAPEDVLEDVIENTESDYLTQSEQNLMMMPDTPANWVAEEGKALFIEKRGPKNASLERCDFGKGPGVVEGVYAEMPRFGANAFLTREQIADIMAYVMHPESPVNQ